MRKLQQQDLEIRRAQARAEGRRLQLERSEIEEQWWDSQRQDYFSDWTPMEQERFKSEQDAMWSLIPEQHRQRARQLARGGM